MRRVRTVSASSDCTQQSVELPGPLPSAEFCQLMGKQKSVSAVPQGAEAPPTPIAINRLSSDSTIDTGVMVKRSGSDLDIAFVGIPSVTY